MPTKKELQEQIVELKEEISNLKDYNDKLECGLVTFECAECDSLKEQNEKLKAENEKIRDEHKKFDEIWKTECITEQDIINMKRQISDQCDLIKKLTKMYEEAHTYVADIGNNLDQRVKENEKLKDRLSIMSATASVHIDDINQIHQDYGNMVRKLEEEIKKLKENQ